MYRVRTVFTGVAGTPWYSNLYFSDQAPGGAAAAVEAVGDFWQLIGGRISSSIDWTVEGEVAIISEGTGELEGIFPETSETGSGIATDDALPYATQGLVRLSTGAYMGGRHIQGRIFVPGLAEDSSGDGVPTEAVVNIMNNAAGALVSNPDVELVVYSRTNFVASPVISATAAPYWAVLRSRRD